MVGKINKTISVSDKHLGDATCLLFYDENLYSGGADGKIKIWNKNLQLKKEIDAHESYIHAIAINSKGELYSSSCDETIRWFPAPLHSNNYEIILRNDLDEIISLTIANDVLYSGDDKGIVTKWNGNKIELMYNLVEEVRSLLVEGKKLYTARDLDVVITELQDGPTGRYMTKGTVPGKSPAILFGPANENGEKPYIIFSTRDGKGIGMVRNKPTYNEQWTKENAHEMIINCFCATQTILYSAGYDGKVKKWVELDNGPQNAAEVDIGSCINAICVGSDNTIYVADTNGIITSVSFSSKAA